MWIKTLSSAIDQVQVSRCVPEGQEHFVKTRQFGMQPIVALGNVYMQLADAKIRMFHAVNTWITFEKNCFERVHQRGCEELRETQSLRIPRLPGAPIRVLLRQHNIEIAAIFQAGRELRRCHELDDKTFAHGDPHLGNLLWDGHRAWLIDFETEYLPTIPTPTRRANDLLVVLLDLMAEIPDAEWLEWASQFLRGYGGDKTVEKTLVDLLNPPQGIPKVLWSSRTRRLSWDKVCAKAQEIQRLLWTNG